jgi:8-oxo-dGTP diphosphatase
VSGGRELPRRPVAAARDLVHTGLLKLYRRLPVHGRRFVVRSIAPTYTVGAVCVIERDDGRILLVRLAYRHRWGMPGGLLKRGEQPADAARREVREEVGFDVELVGDAAVVVDPEPRRVDLVYRARPHDGARVDDVAPRSPEIVEARWFPKDALPELQHETAQALVAVARRVAPPLTDE